MTPRSQSSLAKSQKPKSSLPKNNVIKLETSIGATTSRRLNPLTAFTVRKTSNWKLDSDTHPPQTIGRGKGKESGFKHGKNKNQNQDDRLWVDMYEPTSEAELAVHCRKVQDVRGWLNEAFEGGPSGKLTRYRRILALTGPAGAAKTTTIHVLAGEMGFEILEWRNVVGESSASWLKGTNSYASNNSHDTFTSVDYDPDRESLFFKFETFLTRALSCQTVFTSKSDLNFVDKDVSYQSSQTQNPSKYKTLTQRSARQGKYHVILLEDLPNILHSNTQLKFHDTLKSLVASPPSFPPVPVIIILSDAGTRGEAIDERMANGGSWGKDKDSALDIRTVLPRELFGGPYVTQICFNPIAPTLLRKALQVLLSKHSASSTRPSPLPKDVLDIIVESANGDIRSAVTALQLACVVGQSCGTKKHNSVAVLGAVTRREQSLALFHLLGKVLYNKRKGDAPNTSASARDIQQDKLIDSRLNDPLKLPPFLQDHERRTSRVDVNMLYTDSPIDASLFSLYIHQNYTQYCDDVNNCDGVADWLSWVDSSGGEAWYQTNPYYFHLLTLGTLHSLPSPVTRRSQKCFKPEFFDFKEKEKKASEGIRDVEGWLHEAGTSSDSTVCLTNGWRRADISTELGGILRARDTVGGLEPRPPASHRLFSDLIKLGRVRNLQALDENDFVDMPPQEEDKGRVCWPLQETRDGGGWLESDDIEEF